VSSEEEKNKELARRFMEARVKGDMDAVDEMMAPDLAAFSDVRYIIEEQVAEGDTVVSRMTMRGTHDRGEYEGLSPTGEETGVSAIVIHRIADCKIAGEWSEGGSLAWLMEQRLEQEARERERVEQELRVARRIQQASLPKEIPTLEGWWITPYYQPARGRRRLLRLPPPLRRSAGGGPERRDRQGGASSSGDGNHLRHA
jgi:predicted ester cyclase